MIQTTFLVAAAIIACASISSNLRAEIVFNNFGPGDTSFIGGGTAIGTSPANFEPGKIFQVSGGSFTLDSVDAAIGYFSGTNQVTLSLYSTTGGLPSTLVESATVAGLANAVDSISPTSFTFGGATVLQEGESYAIVANATAFDFFCMECQQYG